MGKQIELEYVDKRKIKFPVLGYYHGGLSLPNKDGNNIIRVTEKEASALLKKKNGHGNCFVEVKNKRAENKEIKKDDIIKKETKIDIGGIE